MITADAAKAFCSSPATPLVAGLVGLASSSWTARGAAPTLMADRLTGAGLVTTVGAIENVGVNMTTGADPGTMEGPTLTWGVYAVPTDPPAAPPGFGGAEATTPPPDKPAGTIAGMPWAPCPADPPA
jgi:hypothetical protein